MAKEFSRRVSKTERVKIDLSDRLDRDLFARLSDDGLLKGAKLNEIRLADITVKEQVRTKFNDSSIKELAKNIQANGLIQPLVIHHKEGVYTLICGERRFRAMSSISMKSAPCFIIENKTQEELMAIQFSENSSREALHYIDKADGIYNYQVATKASERQIVEALGISKSDVHRSLTIAKLNDQIKSAAKEYDIEKYVLVEYALLADHNLKDRLEKELLVGNITKRVEFKRFLKESAETQNSLKARKPSTIISAKELLSKLSNTDVDQEVLALLQTIAAKAPKKEKVKQKK